MRFNHHLGEDQGIRATVVLQHVYVRVDAKHLPECHRERLFVQRVGLVADAVDERAIHVCTNTHCHKTPRRLRYL